MFDLLTNPPAVLVQIAARYEARKIAFAEWTGILDRELHTHMGMLVFVVVILVFRLPLRSPWPWIAAVIVELNNEFLDRVNYGSWRWPDTKIDLLFTLMWPTLLFICARTRLFTKR